MNKMPMNQLLPYISGYVDGEGCFCVSFNKSKRHKFGWDIGPSFSVSQNADRAEVLTIMKSHFDCGTIRPDRSDQTLKYEVRSIMDLTEKIIPHFQKFPLVSSKQRDFEIFMEICQKILEKEHLTKEGFRNIVVLAEDLNRGSKKKYLRSAFKV
jgi:hypothetical protein